MSPELQVVLGWLTGPLLIVLIGIFCRMGDDE
jgi:hypothetical protein